MANNADNNKLKPKADHTLSALIDQDLQKESELLQDLIREVVDANQKVKKAHQRRMEESQRKLSILNKEIERLKTEINQKENDTTMEQLNYMLDAKNRIYEALQEMRQKNIDIFMKGEASTHVTTLKDRLFSMLKSHGEKHTHITPVMDTFKAQIIHLIDQNAADMTAFFEADHKDYHSLKDTFTKHMKSLKTLSASIDALTSDFEALDDARMHVLQGEKAEQSLDNRIESTFKKRHEQLNQERKTLDDWFYQRRDELIEQKNNIKTTTFNKLKHKHKSRVDAERQSKQNLESDLKDLRLRIIKADKVGDQTKAKELLHEYNRKQRLSEGLFEEKLLKKAEAKVAPKSKAIDKKLYALEKEYIEKLYEHKFKIEKERIGKNDSKERFKLREDAKALADDENFNQKLMHTIATQSDKFKSLLDDIIAFKRALDNLLITRQETFLHLEQTMNQEIGEVETNLRETHLYLTKRFRLKTFDDALLGESIKHEILTHAHKKDAHQQRAKIDKQITDETNRHLIDALNQEEDIQSEKIYQHALIALADKEYELQLLKVQSLYDNEIDLTKVQAERLNIGHDVNEAMISTTLESQINFAKQQIKYAHSEYDLRLENIETTRKKEREYAQEKLNEYQQPYKTDRYNIKKERDQKLEDLAYKQALFTDDKEKRSLKEREEKLRAHYQEKLNAIDDKEAKDPYVARYQKQLNNADERAKKAREDAENIRDKTVETFEAMLKNSEEKLKQYKENKSDTSLSSTVESSAHETAKNRLDESIKEAKALYEEKIAGPKKRLEELEEKLATIHETTERDERIEALKAKKDEISNTTKQTIEALKKTKDKHKSAIQTKREQFLTQHETALNTLKKNQRTMDQTATKKSIESAITQLKKTKASERENLKSHVLNQLQTLKNKQKSMHKTLNNHLKPANRAYQKHIKKFASLQKQREQRIKKDLDAEKHTQLRTVKRKYKQ